MIITTSQSLTTVSIKSVLMYLNKTDIIVVTVRYKRLRLAALPIHITALLAPAHHITPTEVALTRKHVLPQMRHPQAAHTLGQRRIPAFPNILGRYLATAMTSRL